MTRPTTAELFLSISKDLAGFAARKAALKMLDLADRLDGSRTSVLRNVEIHLGVGGQLKPNPMLPSLIRKATVIGAFGKDGYQGKFHADRRAGFNYMRNTYGQTPWRNPNG